VNRRIWVRVIDLDLIEDVGEKRGKEKEFALAFWETKTEKGSFGFMLIVLWKRLVYEARSLQREEEE